MSNKNSLLHLSFEELAILYPGKSRRTLGRYRNHGPPNPNGRPKIPTPKNLAQKFNTLRRIRPPMTLESIAHKLGMDRRTMGRKLDELGILL